MIGWAKLTDNTSIVQGKWPFRDSSRPKLNSRSDFPWEDVPSGTTFCDVGGGIGSVSMELVKAHSNLKVTLQDLPCVIEQARTVSYFLILSGANLIYIYSVLDQGIFAGSSRTPNRVRSHRFHEGMSS
jgi:hypothetical protein